MPDPFAREKLLTQAIPEKQTAAVEVQRITLSPHISGGAHTHNGPVFGTIERGSVTFQVEGGAEQVLTAGDVFYEPAEHTIARWDAGEIGVAFLAFYVLGEGQMPVLTPSGD